MNRTMSLKGFVLILGLMLAAFLVLHLTMKSGVNEKAQKEKALKVELTRLQEENKGLTAQLNMVGTDEYIMSSAVKNYSYVKKDAIRFEYTNPEALYAYSQEELQILLDEMND